MIGNCGPGLAFLGLIIVPLIFAVPIALVSAELGTSLPEVGGSYAWVKRALGPFWGFTIGTGRTFYFWIGGGSLIVLAVGYIQEFFNLSRVETILISMAIIIISSIINIIGLDLIGWTSKIFTIIIIVPFVLLVIVGLTKLNYNPVTPFMNPNNDIGTNFGYGIAIAIWMYGGWESAANYGGEIRNFSKIFPKAVLITMILMVITYIAPNLVGVSAVGHWELWGADGGYDLVSICREVGGPILAGLMLFAAIFSNIILYVDNLAQVCRQPYAMAEENLFPKFFSKLHRKFKAPYWAIVFQAIVTAGACMFSFETLVGFLVFLSFLTPALILISTVVLRIKEPELERPFKIPGNCVMIVLLFIPFFCIAAYSIVGNGINSLLGFIAFIIIIPIFYSIISVTAAFSCPEIDGNFCPPIAEDLAGRMTALSRLFSFSYENSHSKTYFAAWSSIMRFLDWLPYSRRLVQTLSMILAVPEQ